MDAPAAPAAEARSDSSPGLTPAPAVTPQGEAARAGRRFDRSIVEGPIAPAVWKIAWPTVLQNAIGGLQGIIDHAMVGHYVGFTGNAAIGVSWQIFLVVIVFISSLFTGMGVLVARFAGANQPDRVNRTVYQAFLTAVVLAVGARFIGHASATLPIDSRIAASRPSPPPPFATTPRPPPPRTRLRPRAWGVSSPSHQPAGDLFLYNRQLAAPLVQSHSPPHTPIHLPSAGGASTLSLSQAASPSSPSSVLACWSPKPK